MHRQELSTPRGQRAQDDEQHSLRYHGPGKGREHHLPLGASPAQHHAVQEGAVHDRHVGTQLGKGVPSSA